jgi:polyribonucleotide nucleotidyltransferase
MSETQTFTTQWAGRDLTIEVGKYAKQANGSCLVTYGGTTVLATAVMSDDVREGLGFFPLMTEYEEKFFAAGRIKGSRFMKRSGRPSDGAVLTSRMIDRAIRPLFDDSIRNDIQVIVSCLAFDGENDPDVIGLIAASCALHMSDIPWAGPISAIRVGQINEEWVLNPTYKEREESVLDLGFAGTPETIIMVEAGAKEVPEETVLGGYWHGMENLEAPIKLIEEVRTAVGKEKRDRGPKTDEEKEIAAKKEEIQAIARPFVLEQIEELFFKAPQSTKGERTAQKKELKKRTEAFLLEQGVDPEHVRYGTGNVVDILESEVVRNIIENDKRIDGRKLTETRTLISEPHVVDRVHGSAHFSRGETQVCSFVTLGSPGDEMIVDSMEVDEKVRYFHHYNFPPFSVGEVKPLRGASRRDIGHGALAEKALIPMLPSKEDFPYTIQVNSEVYGSNGSSSMASTCGSTLALMDAGVPIRAAVAGVAMGLASDDQGRWKVLTDLQDLEDGKGGMDFKIAGSKEGITAIQMDTKTLGLSKEIVEKCFMQAKEARLEMLESMLAVIPEPRAELSPYAPRIITLQIDPERIGDLIGPGGKMINGIIEETGVTSIDIDDSGLVMITSTDAAAADKALEMATLVTKEVEKGETYKGKVVRLMDFGAIVEFLPKKDGLVHVSNLAPWRVEKVEDIVKLGQEVFVKVIEVGDGKISLSMKDAEGNVYPERPPATSRPPRRDDRRPRGGFQRGPRGPQKPTDRTRQTRQDS